MDRTKVSFAEAENKQPYPAILKWGELDQRIRQRLWRAFSEHYVRTITTVYGNNFDSRQVNIFWNDIYSQYRIEIKFEYHDDVYGDQRNTYSRIENIIKSSNYVDLFDFLQFALREKYKSENRDAEFIEELATNVKISLDEPYSPYRLLIESLTIVPVLSSEQALTLELDLKRVYASPFRSAATHMGKAIEGMNKGDHAGTVREAITAVESAAVEYLGEPKSDLAAALKKLSREAGSHPALLNAFKILYGYTSDERGIRHSSLFGEQPAVEFEEAIFFVSACAAFIGYLSQKARKAATSS